ncbi:hypothetical protein ABG067_007818 [Albugo candida]
MLVPFINNGTLNNQQKRFNKVQSSTRQKIENTFSLLVSRWRFLYKHVYLEDVARITDAITTCCVLHNLCIDGGDSLEQYSNPSRFTQFQEEDNQDGGEFVVSGLREGEEELHLEEHDEQVDEDDDGGAVDNEVGAGAGTLARDMGNPLNFTSVRQFDAYQRQLRARAVIKRNDIMQSL